jgi:hypothetical protein
MNDERQAPPAEPGLYWARAIRNDNKRKLWVLFDITGEAPYLECVGLYWLMVNENGISRGRWDPISNSPDITQYCQFVKVQEPPLEVLR